MWPRVEWRAVEAGAERALEVEHAGSAAVWWCPSCGGRRMTERAAHLVDAVLPWVQVRQWTPHHLSSGNFSTLLGVVERAAREHGDEDPERAVRNTPESTRVSMALAPQAAVVVTTVRVVLNTGA